MHVHVFIPCFIDQLYPTAGFNTIKVLERAGCTVHYNANQTAQDIGDQPINYLSYSC
jgi:L-lactate dehydrogenase complex protein LldE